ncbi:MAG: C10 family peptidase [Bacteroidales bacterium]
MKLKKLNLLFLLVLFSTFTFAKEVEVSTVKQVAKNCYFQQKALFNEFVDYNSIIIDNVDLYSQNEIPAIYAVNFQNGGYVLVSAQDAMSPIIGFNTEDNVQFDLQARGPQFEFFFDSHLEQIEHIAISKLDQSEKIKAQWDELTTDNIESLITVKDRNEVGPLLPTLWNQDSPYNYYAPETTIPGVSGGKCYAGCVATAMSTIMQYWGWPLQGVGSHSYYLPVCGVTLSANFGETEYNYYGMPHILKTQHGEFAIHEVAQLQYHCGVAVNMGFCIDGCFAGGPGDGSSGAYSTAVAPALKAYFKYPNAMYVTKNQQASNWENLLKNQFDQGYPVYYSGYGSLGGHAWNCDGYRTVGSTNYFHHNFNWGGYLNDWFTEPGLVTPGFGSDHAMNMNVVPPTDQYPVYAEGEYILKENYGRITDGSGPIENYLAGASASWLIDPQTEFDTITNITIKWSKFELGNNDFIKLYDGKDENAPLVGTYSGTTLPEDFTSTGNQLYVTFEATGSNPGFEFEYFSKLGSFCEDLVEINDQSGEIRSNPENKHYNPNTYCRWLISPSDNSLGLKLRFNYLDTYDEKDFVTFFDIKTGEETVFYGTETPEEEFEYPNGVLVQFETDLYHSENTGFSISFNNGLGIQDYSIGEIKAYPNPAKDIVTIEFDNNESENLEIEMYDITGAILYKDTFDSKGLYTKEINISKFPAGIYFINIKSELGMSSKKIIIQ